ncbi:phage antirepressor KilAC domain-containing protein [Haloechinothrix sp. YIM 98757]|uniref:Phage antirepressor KilAC domain-containing protein n=1 Tax=Haloechinothrix aidingensis TaxID=2752311 RepID=A0A838AAK9_9PSEU|nr:phage antirepressor KilAC domain-containing protein [Haloechinothrix aidingensis]MBA0126271.1 phage antirepressor KilAC domain-containing protein [Haloechinothrix aidingensis]
MQHSNDGFFGEAPRGESSDLDLFGQMDSGLLPEHFGLAEDGTPYVIAGTFARALGYRDAANAGRLLDEEEKGTQIVSTPGGDQRVSVIYEDGIWELIFRSTLPVARAIKAKVKRILRELRQNGYVDTRQKPMSELEMARKYVAALERNQELEPKAEAYDEFMTAEGDYPVATVAQILGLGQNRLFSRLRYERVLITGGRRHNTPYQEYVHHFRVAARYFEDGRGRQRTTYTTYVKPSGVEFIRKVLKLQESAA